MGFPRRVLEERIANEVDQIENYVNQVKNKISSILSLNDSLGADELDRMNLAQEQRDYLADLIPKLRAIHDEIVSKGF